MVVPTENEFVIGNTYTSLIYFPTGSFTEDIPVTKCILCLSRFLLYFLPLLKLFGICQFSEPNTVCHCTSLKCLFYFTVTLHCWSDPQLGQKCVFREDQKATHRLLLYSFYTMEEPKYQLEQETPTHTVLFYAWKIYTKQHVS